MYLCVRVSMHVDTCGWTDESLHEILFVGQKERIDVYVGKYVSLYVCMCAFVCVCMHVCVY